MGPSWGTLGLCPLPLRGGPVWGRSSRLRSGLPRAYGLDKAPCAALLAAGWQGLARGKCPASHREWGRLAQA